MRTRCIRRGVVRLDLSVVAAVTLYGRHDQAHARQARSVVDGAGRREYEPATSSGLLYVSEAFQDHVHFLITAEGKRRKLAMYYGAGTVSADFGYAQSRSKVYAIQIQPLWTQQWQQVAHRRIGMLVTPVAGLGRVAFKDALQDRISAQT